MQRLGSEMFLLRIQYTAKFSKNQGLWATRQTTEILQQKNGFHRLMVRREGLEPTTKRLRVSCSTN